MKDIFSQYDFIIKEVYKIITDADYSNDWFSRMMILSQPGYSAEKNTCLYLFFSVLLQKAFPYTLRPSFQASHESSSLVDTILYVNPDESVLRSSLELANE